MKCLLFDCLSLGPSVLEIFHLLLQKLRIATDSLIGMAKVENQTSYYKEDEREREHLLL